MTARLPQSTTSLAKRIKPAMAGKLLAAVWPAAAADSFHFLKIGDTATTIITRAASGATYDATTGRIKGTSTTYATMSVAGGFGGLMEKDDFSFGANYFGDFYNGSGAAVKTMISGSAPPDVTGTGFALWAQGYSVKAGTYNSGGAVIAPSAGISNNIAEVMGYGYRTLQADATAKQRGWANGVEYAPLRSNYTNTLTSKIGDTARPVYFGSTFTDATDSRTTLEFEFAWFGTGAMTDADMVAITTDPSQFIEDAPVDTTVPTMTGTMTSSAIAATSFTVDWSATTRSDDVAITGYETSPDNATWTDQGNVTAKSFTGKTASTGYTTYVRAYDAAGNKSIPSLSLLVTTAAPPDAVVPTMNGSLTSSSVTGSGYTLSWLAASDNVAVTGYERSADSGATWINVGNVLAIAVTGAAAATLYHTRVRAYDAAGNKAAALSLDVTTSGTADTTLPTLSGAITVSAITTSGYTLSWPAGGDNIAVTGYERSADNGSTWVDVGNVLTIAVGGAAAGTAYTVRVRAYDAAGNRSTPALSATVTTTATSAGTFITDQWTTSTTIRANQAYTATWYNLGAIGSVGGTPTFKSGNLSALGAATLAGLPAGAGFVLGATADGGRFFQEGVVT